MDINTGKEAIHITGKEGDKTLNLNFVTIEAEVNTVFDEETSVKLSIEKLSDEGMEEVVVDTKDSDVTINIVPAEKAYVP